MFFVLHCRLDRLSHVRHAAFIGTGVRRLTFNGLLHVHACATKGLACRAHVAPARSHVSPWLDEALGLPANHACGCASPFCVRQSIVIQRQVSLCYYFAWHSCCVCAYFHLPCRSLSRGGVAWEIRKTASVHVPGAPILDVLRNVEAAESASPPLAQACAPSAAPAADVAEQATRDKVGRWQLKTVVF